MLSPALKLLESIPPLESGSNRPLDFDFENQLKTLVSYHLEEHISGHYLLQELAEEGFERSHVTSDVKRSTLHEALSTLGVWSS